MTSRTSCGSESLLSTKSCLSASPEGTPAAFLTHATQKIFAHDSVRATVGPLELLAAQNTVTAARQWREDGSFPPVTAVTASGPTE